MAKPVKRNREPMAKLDLTNLAKGVYFDENSFGEIHPMQERQGECGREFVYTGKIHQGECSFVVIDDSGISTFPCYDGYNHGFTLEGTSQNLFKAEGALSNYNSMEKRTFNYFNPDSKLTFVGDSKVNVTIYVRFYDENRWCVIYSD